MTRDDVLAKGLPLTDAEIAGFMGWRGPGAYSAATMRKIKQVIAEAVARDRSIDAMVTKVPRIPSLADMLSGKAIQEEEQPPKKKRTAPTASATMESFERNAHKPCSVEGCNKSRHKSVSGKCHTTKCTEHYMQKYKK